MQENAQVFENTSFKKHHKVSFEWSLLICSNVLGQSRTPTFTPIVSKHLCYTLWTTTDIPSLKHLHTRTHFLMHTCTHAHTHSCTRAHMNTRTHAHTHTHTLARSAVHFLTLEHLNCLLLYFKPFISDNVPPHPCFCFLLVVIFFFFFFAFTTSLLPSFTILLFIPLCLSFFSLSSPTVF